jgi:hypothetical protein
MSRPFRLAQTVFTRKMWDRWLERLNRSDHDPQLVEGMAEMRRLLQGRDIASQLDAKPRNAK